MDENMGPTDYLAYLDEQPFEYEKILAAQQALAQSTKNLLVVWTTAHQSMLKDVSNLAKGYSSFAAGGNIAVTGAPAMSGQSAGDFQKTSAATRVMTRETFEEWITYARRASDLTRTMFTSSISAIGDGIGSQLIDGTYQWRDAWKAVLKQIIATAAELIIVQTLMAVLTGGTSAAAKGGLGGIIGAFFHTGGLVPRHHSGILSRDEHLAVLQRGEYVVQRSSVQALGVDALDRINRTGQAPAGPTFHVSVAVQAGGTNDPRRLAEQIAEPLIEILRRESARNRKII